MSGRGVPAVHRLPFESVLSKNKFENLVHLVGFIIRIYHDARSSECQTKKKVQNDLEMTMTTRNEWPRLKH
jgi:hypothetical protein